MNYLLVSSRLVSSSENTKAAKKQVGTSSKIVNLLLGICGTAIALPLITGAVLLSMFLPQGKWEEFWDSFL